MPFKGEKKVEEFIYDFAVDGGAVGNINLSAKANETGLPQGAIVQAVGWRVLAALTSGGSATVSVGDAASTARYKALTAFDNAAYALDAVQAAAIGVPMLVDSADKGKFGLSIAVAALTAGKIAFYVEYYLPKN